MKFLKKIKVIVVCAAMIVVAGNMAPVEAQDDAMLQDGLLPQTAVSVDARFPADEETHPPLRLTPDKSEIIDLGEPATRIIVGSDMHLNLLMDTATRLIAVPRVPGATYFTVLGEEGKVIMQRHAIVANPTEKYVRIREACTMARCEPVRMYYCPGMCHEITIESEGASTLSGTLSEEGAEALGSMLGSMLQ